MTSEEVDIEARLVRALDIVASSVPERPPTTFRTAIAAMESEEGVDFGLYGFSGSPDDDTDPAQIWNPAIDSIAPSGLPSGHRLSRRWRLVAAVGLTAALAGVGASVAAATGAFTSPAPQNPLPIGAGIQTGSTDAYYMTSMEIFVTTDGARSFQAVKPPIPVSSIRGVGVATGAVFVVANQHSTPSASEDLPFENTVVYRSSDNGRSWSTTVLTGLPGEPGVYAFVSSGTQVVGLVVTAATSSAFSEGAWYSTSDGGRTWAEHALPVGGTVTAAGSQLWLVGGSLNNQLYASSNGGESWARSKTPSTSSEVGAQFGLSPPHLAANGHLVLAETEENVSPAKVFLFSSADNGTTWASLGSVVVHGQYGGGAGAVVGLEGNSIWVISASGSESDELARVNVPSGVAQQIQPVGLDGSINSLQPTSAKDAIATIGHSSCGGSKANCKVTFGLVSTHDGGQKWAELVPSSPGLSLIPKQVSPPPQQITTGPALSRAAILRTVNLVGVTRYAIKTMPYKTIEDALHSIGLGLDSNVDPNWTPVPLADPVDVVVVAGNISPAGSHESYSWKVEIINPVNGVQVSNSASSSESWPSFFDSLPDRG